MNGAMSRPLAPTCVPEKIERSTDGSIALDTSPIDSAMLITKPVWVSIIRMPEPIPRWAGGTTPITALVLGEMNSPEPAPITSCHSASCQYGVSTWMVVSPSRPDRGDEHPERRQEARPDPVRQRAADRRQDEQAERERREHQPGRHRVVAARALEVEDQQEQHPGPRDPVEQPGQVAEREQPVAEQAEVEERRRVMRLDPQEGGRRDDERREAGEDPGRGPAVDAAEGERRHQAGQPDQVQGAAGEIETGALGERGPARPAASPRRPCRPARSGR